MLTRQCRVSVVIRCPMSRSPVSEFLKTQNTEIPASASASHRARASDRGRARLEEPEPPVPALLSPQAAQFQGGHRTQSSEPRLRLAGPGLINPHCDLER